HGDKERYGRDERQHVLEPRGLHRLRIAEHEEDERDGHREEGDRDPLEAHRLSERRLLLIAQFTKLVLALHRSSFCSCSVRKVSSSVRKAFSPMGASMTSLSVVPSGSVTSR